MWIVEYRELIKILTVSDLKVKYQSSVLGFAWSLLNPLLMMLVLYLVFNNVFKNNQNHFALYLLIGIISWHFLSIGTSASMMPYNHDLHVRRNTIGLGHRSIEGLGLSGQNGQKDYNLLAPSGSRPVPRACGIPEMRWLFYGRRTHESENIKEFGDYANKNGKSY